MFETKKVPACDVRGLREALNGEMKTHVLDHLEGVEHWIALAQDQPVAVVTGLPLDPRGNVASDWLQLVGFAGDREARHVLVDAMASGPAPRAMWSLASEGVRLEQASGPCRGIRVLHGLQAVRKRPGMYVGGTGVRGATHLVLEVLANTIDEHLAGHATTLEVTYAEGVWQISDDGRGIPAGRSLRDGTPAFQAIFTRLHHAETWDGRTYHTHSGLHGVGLGAVCALSERLDVESRRDGHLYTQKFSRASP